MTKRLRISVLMIILFVFTTALVAAAVDNPDKIRDIRGPIPPSGPPPFTVSAAILFLAAAGVIIFRLNRDKSPTPPWPDPASEPLLDELLSLRDAYLRGELPDWLLFDKLSRLIRSMLSGDDHSALTSKELILAARDFVPVELLARTETLLELFDKVRFGGFNPGKDVSVRAIDEILHVIRNPPERNR